MSRLLSCYRQVRAGADGGDPVRGDVRRDLGSQHQAVGEVRQSGRSLTLLPCSRPRSLRSTLPQQPPAAPGHLPRPPSCRPGAARPGARGQGAGEREEGEGGGRRDLQWSSVLEVRGVQQEI